MELSASILKSIASLLEWYADVFMKNFPFEAKKWVPLEAKNSYLSIFQKNPCLWQIFIGLIFVMSRTSHLQDYTILTYTWECTCVWTSNNLGRQSRIYCFSIHVSLKILMLQFRELANDFQVQIFANFLVMPATFFCET